MDADLAANPPGEPARPLAFDLVVRSSTNPNPPHEPTIRAPYSVDMLIRPATVGDAPALMRIYNVEVLHSTVTFDLVERTLDEQREWISQRQGAHVVLVADDESSAEPDDSVLGFAALSPFRERPAYSTTVEDSVYVRRDAHGKGVGTRLLGELVSTATRNGFHAMLARIVAGHDASIGLHARHGFEQVGVEREIGRKFGRWLDVVVMERLLDGAQEPKP